MKITYYHDLKNNFPSLFFLTLLAIGCQWESRLHIEEKRKGGIYSEEVQMECMDALRHGGHLQISINSKEAYDSLYHAHFKKPFLLG